MTERRGWRAAWLALAALLVILLSAAIAPGSGASRPLAHRGSLSPKVNVWITSANQQMELAKQAPVSFSASSPSYETITVDPTRAFQTMTGFGGSINDSSPYNLSTLPPPQRAQAMRMLFDRKTGDGLDFLRQPIGASDMVAGSQDYTYDD